MPYAYKYHSNLLFLLQTLISHLVGIRSTVVERVTHMRVYIGLSPTSVDHRKELI